MHPADKLACSRQHKCNCRTKRAQSLPNYFTLILYLHPNRLAARARFRRAQIYCNALKANRRRHTSGPLKRAAASLRAPKTSRRAIRVSEGNFCRPFRSSASARRSLVATRASTFRCSANAAARGAPKGQQRNKSVADNLRARPIVNWSQPFLPHFGAPF